MASGSSAAAAAAGAAAVRFERVDAGLRLDDRGRGGGDGREGQADGEAVGGLFVGSLGESSSVCLRTRVEAVPSDRDVAETHDELVQEMSGSVEVFIREGSGEDLAETRVVVEDDFVFSLVRQLESSSGDVSLCRR